MKNEKRKQDVSSQDGDNEDDARSWTFDEDYPLPDESVDNVGRSNTVNVADLLLGRSAGSNNTVDLPELLLRLLSQYFQQLQKNSNQLLN